MKGITMEKNPLFDSICDACLDALADMHDEFGTDFVPMNDDTFTMEELLRNLVDTTDEELCYYEECRRRFAPEEQKKA